MERTYNLNTGLIVHLLCVNLDHTYLSEIVYNMEEDWAVEQYGEGNYEILYDKQANLECIEWALNKTIEEEVMPLLQQYGIESIQLGGWQHPKDYTYKMDMVDLNVTVDTAILLSKANEKIREWIKIPAIDVMIGKNFASGPGYWSLQPESLLELAKALFNGSTPTEYAVGEYIAVLLWDEFGYEGLQSILESNYLSHSDSCNIAITIEKLTESINN